MKLRYIAFILISGILFYACNQTKKNKVDASIVQDTSISAPDISELIVENPDNPFLYARRAKSYAEINDYNKALADISKAIELDSMQAEFYINQAEYYIFTARPNSAKKTLERCLNIMPDNIDCLIKQAELHFYLKEYPRTISLLRDLRKQAPNEPQVYFIGGLLSAEMGDTTNAIENLQICTSKDPDYYAAYVELGRLHYEKGEELAISYFNTAIELIPESYEAHYFKGMYFQEHDRLDEAIEEYQFIINSIDASVQYPYYNLGYIYLVHKQDYDQAIDWFTQAIDKDEQYIEAWYNRGYAFELKNDTVHALKDYRKSLEIFPDYPLSIRGVERLSK